MARKRYTPEQIIRKLREAEVFIAEGMTAAEAAHKIGVRMLYIEPGSPWENGYIKSFNGKLRDELLSREVFDTLLEAKVLVERCRQEYNHIRPHSSLGYRPPAPEVVIPIGISFTTQLPCSMCSGIDCVVNLIALHAVTYLIHLDFRV